MPVPYRAIAERRFDLPCDGKARVGGVRTTCSRLGTTHEEGAQRGLLLRNSFHHRLERTIHALAGAL